ncbi:ABC transporter substrate-binding protein [Marinobacter fuscus]|uniref:ABC transporter substrate-binding protein n=1 Tax=Marinobacter fuscus TaxID=2109942 RepID=UPI0013FDEB16|nr:ABC transporter substrate-binding protein [Marinobacter fuscus]
MSSTDIIKYGTLRIPTAVLVGIEKGFFSSEGIEVEPVFFKSGAEIAPAVATGQVDVAATTSGAPLFNALSRGIEVKIVADALRLEKGSPGGDPTSIVASKAFLEMIKGSNKSLEGAKIGITAPGQILDMIVREYIDSSGLDINDVDLVSMPMPDMLVALENNAIDTAIMLDPFTTFAIKRGIGEVLIRGSDVVPGIQQAFLLYSNNLANENHELGQKFMNGYYKTNSWLRKSLVTEEGRKEIADIYQKYIPSRNKAIYEEIALSVAVEDLSINVDGQYGLLWQIDKLKERGLLRGDPEIKNQVDSSFISGFNNHSNVSGDVNE